jgi:hypothetical protein
MYDYKRLMLPEVAWHHHECNVLSVTVLSALLLHDKEKLQGRSLKSAARIPVCENLLLVRGCAALSKRNEGFGTCIQIFFVVGTVVLNSLSIFLRKRKKRDDTVFMSTKRCPFL